MLEKGHALLAVQDTNFAEAITNVVVVDLATRKGRRMLQLGCTGESVFEFSPANDMIVYSDCRGIFTVKVHDAKGNILPTWKERFLVVPEEPHAGFTYWADSSNVGWCRDPQGSMRVMLYPLRPR